MISQIKEINFPEYATLSQATVTINDMGDRTITASVDIDGSIAPDFSYDWEVEFKGERYIQPLRQPQASKRDEYRRSKIDLVFYHWAIWQLKRYYFVEMTSTESGTAIADKYIASLGLNLRDFCVAFNKVLDYYFDGQITIQLNPDYNDAGGVQYVGISYSYIWDVLQSMYETYGVRWEIKSLSNDKYVIKVGYAPAALSHVFQYGFEGGLLNIERQVQDTNIRNSLLGRGGEQNLPAYYFKEAPEGSLFASDPDAIPELANIYFSNLRGKTFRDYVKGWKARHYGGATMSNPTPEYLAGYNDSKFNPIEYVKDDASIAKYGLFQGALENNENIYPSIQGAEGEVNTVVYVEPILTDEVNPEVEPAKTIQLPSMSESRNVTLSDEGTTISFYLQSENFTVPEGHNNYALNIANSATYNIYSWGALGYEGNPLVSIYETVYNADTNTSADKDALEPGTYYAKTIFQVTIPVSNFDTTAQQHAISRVVTASTNLELRELQTNGSDAWTPTFDIWVKDIWNSTRKSGESDEQYADRVWKPILGDRQGNSAAVCFSSGWLARNDYDFIIVDYAFDDSKSYQGVSSEWRLTLAKSDAELEATGKYIPSASTNGQAYAGDTFYFIGIDMPYEYVLWAEEALDNYKYAELYKISEIQPKWVVKFDKIRIHEGDDPLVDKIVAGGLVSITDKRFSPDAALALYLTSVTYTWNDSTTMLPDIEVVLADRVTVVHNPVAQMQSSIELLQSQVGSMAAIPQLIRSICDRLYLRKDGLSDTSLSPTKFASIISGRNFSQGMVGGTDWGIYKDGNGRSVAEFDKLVVRNEMTVNNLVVNQVTAVGGTQIMSAAAMECSRVVETDDSYECFFEQKEGTVANMFAVNDIAYSQVFNPEGNSIKYYKRVVTAISENSITLSKTNADGSGIPMAGDNIVQFGNLTDVDRQSFIVIEPLNGGSIKVFAGVNTFDLDKRNYVGLGVNPTTNRAYLYGYGDMFFGDRNLKSNFITYQIPDPTPENPNPDPILVINADVQLGVGSTGLSNLSEYKDLQDQIANAGDVYYYEEDASLDNEPAATWIKEGKEADHLNAIYHNTATGDSWRWVEENGVYKWKLNVNSLDYLKEAFPKNPAFMSNGLLLASMIGVWDENQNLVAGLYGGGSDELNQENGLWDAEHGAMLVFGGVSGLGTDEFNYKTAIFEDGFLKSTTFATATEGPRVEINDNRIHIHGKDETAKIEIGYDAETGQPVLQYIDRDGNHAWSAGATGISNAMTIDTAQVVTGSKDFVGGILVNGRPLVWDEENLSWILPGNLIVTGGLATYSTFNNKNVISVYDGLPIDGTTIYWSVGANGDKILKAATGGGTGGGIDESQLEDYLTTNGYATQTWVTNKGYALQSSLTAVDNRLKSVETFFATDDADPYVNKWDEIVTFLDAVEGDTLDDILSTKFDKSSFTYSNIKSTLGIYNWALASAKPSYSYSEISGRPTSLSDLEDDILEGKYLPLTGGTTTGNITVKKTGGATFWANNTKDRIGLQNDSNCGIYYVAQSPLPTGYASTGWLLGFNRERTGAWFTTSLVVGHTSATSSYKLLVKGATRIEGQLSTTTSSDRRLKENIRKADVGMYLRSLGGAFAFEYISEEVERDEFYSGTHIGFIYQNIKSSLLSSMCIEREDGYGSLNYLHSDYLGLLGAAAISHEDRLAKLEKRVEQLEKE